MTASVSDNLLRTLVAEFADDSVHGAALSGSFARGEADAFSDVDLVLYARRLPERGAHRLLYRDGRLVSVEYQSVRHRFHDMKHPATAIFAVPALRRLRVVLDRDGSVVALRRAALGFAWEPLQPLADGWSGRTLVRLAEVVHKVLGGVAAEDAGRTIPPTLELLSELTWAVATQRGVLIDSDRTYHRRVRDADGREEPWSRQHRLAAGLDDLGNDDRSSTLGRGRAAARLYRETAALLQPILAGESVEVVAGAVERVEGTLGGNGRPQTVAS